MAKAMEAASGKDIPLVYGPRRAGDLAVVYANPTKAQRELGWKATLGVEEMARDAWKWPAYSKWTTRTKVWTSTTTPPIARTRCIDDRVFTTLDPQGRPVLLEQVGSCLLG